MEIRYANLPGCLALFLGICTLGIANLIIYLQRRRWPALVDDTGLVLRDGTRIPWSDVAGAEEVVTDVDGTVARRLDLHTRVGTVAFPYERANDGRRIADHLLARLSQRVASPYEPQPQPQSQVQVEPQPEPQPRPPMPGPPGTQTYYCSQCGFRWGPVGVRPYVPNAPERQLFLLCRACSQPQARMSGGDGSELACTSCGTQALGPLDTCPRCHDTGARWI